MSKKDHQNFRTLIRIQEQKKSSFDPQLYLFYAFPLDRLTASKSRSKKKQFELHHTEKKLQ